MFDVDGISKMVRRYFEISSTSVWICPSADRPTVSCRQLPAEADPLPHGTLVAPAARALALILNEAMEADVAANLLPAIRFPRVRELHFSGRLLAGMLCSGHIHGCLVCKPVWTCVGLQKARNGVRLPHRACSCALGLLYNMP